MIRFRLYALQALRQEVQHSCTWVARLHLAPPLSCLVFLPYQPACAAQGSPSTSAPPAPPPAGQGQGQGQPRDTIATIAIAAEGGRAGGAREGLAGAEETEAADFANYFYSYAELDHQKQMLEDDR